MDDGDAATGTVRRLNPRIQAVWASRAVGLAAIVGGLLAVGHALAGVPRWAPIAGIVGVLLVGVPLAVARYRRWGYEIRDDALYLERGVFTEVRTVVPLVRIQHVDSRRTPIERVAGLASTVVYTAGSRGSDVRVPGLTPEGARELRERLKRLAILNEGEDAV